MLTPTGVAQAMARKWIPSIFQNPDQSVVCNVLSALVFECVGECQSIQSNGFQHQAVIYVKRPVHADLKLFAIAFELQSIQTPHVVLR